LTVPIADPISKSFASLLTLRNPDQGGVGPLRQHFFIFLFIFLLDSSMHVIKYPVILVTVLLITSIVIHCKFSTNMNIYVYTILDRESRT
jgi:hypothetical protein